MRRLSERRSLDHRCEVVDVVENVKQHDDVVGSRLDPRDRRAQHLQLLLRVLIGTAQVDEFPAGVRRGVQAGHQALPESFLGPGDSHPEGVGVTHQDKAASPGLWSLSTRG